MSLNANLQTLITRIGTEFKTIRTLISGSGTGDVSGLTTTATNLVAAVNEVKETADAAAPADTDAVPEGATNLYYTDTRADARVQNAINDAGTATTELLSANQVDARITTAVNNLINGASAAYDTLQELANEITGNDSEIANLLAGQANRLRFDAAQTLTQTQRDQAFSNLDLGADINNQDFEAVFVAALA